MKRNIRISIFFALLPAFFLLLFTVGCKKASDTSVTEPQNGEFWLKGSVINAKTHTGIANAKVYFDGQTVLTTDANGLYKVNCKTMGCGAYDVRVMADGYGFGFASATIANNAAIVNTILLKPLTEPIMIGSTGGTFSLIDPESLMPGGETTLAVPAGALSGDINVTLTRFTGIDVPGYAPDNMLNLCAFNLGPVTLVAGKAVELRFAMPFADPTIDNLPLLRYDFDANNWVNTGISAHVNQSTNIATVQVTTFGTYSLAISGAFSEGIGTSEAPVTQSLSTTLSQADFSYQAKNEYPDGTPSTISTPYLRNLASQNTKINGTRVSFTDATLFSFNYIGSKPDSLAPAKSTSSGYYRWVPKVSYATHNMPMSTTIHGTTTGGTIQKLVYSDACGYQFVHDQGGGGK
ncbi:MAG: hypothetical protein NTW16_17020 [Bacteroidetes bacterium]|nr:hypothetical protein [Bacteroidota bacterium]